MTQHSLFAADALLPSGWARNVLLSWNEAGTLTQVEANTVAPAGVPHADGPLLPGMPNLHSHAFQRGFAGLTEYRAAAEESFWSWRELMYRFALRLSPDTLEAIATQLYIEMLNAGYTSVCEFHYVHHAEDGQPYANAAEMSLRLLRAADQVGIGITLLPVLYQTASFGGKPAQADQRRFLHQTEAMLALLDQLAPACRAQGARLGLAPHSLRAVTPESLHDALAGLEALDPNAPIHIHIAEQQREVQDCLAWSGQRPVEWLLNNAAVDARWCLVHATHMNEHEALRLAASGAVAGICATTEANLGDGVFDAPRYLEAGGAWGIGSDSHASVSVSEDLRLFEYSQRLTLQRRNVLASPSHPQVAERLYLDAVVGGARANGRAIAGLAVGQQADLVVLDGTHAAIAGLSATNSLSAHVFANHGSSAIAQVWSAGRCRVEAGRHPLAARAAQDFIAARRALLDAS